MYSFARCSVPSCGRLVFAGEETCLAHSGPEAMATALAHLESTDALRDLSFDGASFEDIDLSGKRFYGCSFRRAAFKGVLFTRTILRLCLFDGSTMESCDLSHLDAQFSSFGGARLSNVSFEDSELLHDSFCGASITECTFNNSNLYDSRFIRCELINSDFVDCNLKRVYLIPSKEEGVSYKLSNTMEAVRDREHLYL